MHHHLQSWLLYVTIQTHHVKHLNDSTMPLRNDTWLGGPRAVGKTAEEAKKVYEDVMALEARPRQPSNRNFKLSRRILEVLVTSSVQILLRFPQGG